MSAVALMREGWKRPSSGLLGYALVASFVAHAGALVVPFAMHADRDARPAPLLVTVAPPRPEPMVATPVEPKPIPPKHDDRHHRHEPVQGTPVPAAAKAPTPPVPVPLAQPVPQRVVEAPVTPARVEAPAATPSPATIPAPAATNEGNVAPARPVESAASPASAPASTVVAAVSTPQREAARPGANGAADRIEPPHFGLAYLNNPQPAYPAAARRMRLEGTVLVRVRVSASGVPEEVLVATSSGTPLLDDAAMNAIRAWRFVPARRGDTPITHWAEVPVRFRLQE